MLKTLAAGVFRLVGRLAPGPLRLALAEEWLCDAYGEKAAGAAKAALPLLLSGDASKKSVDGFMEAFTLANLPLARAVCGEVAGLALSDERAGGVFADSLLQSLFGEGYDFARVSRLVESESAARDEWPVVIND